LQGENKCKKSKVTLPDSVIEKGANCLQLAPFGWLYVVICLPVALVIWFGYPVGDWWELLKTELV
jgi:hypothetical protein